MYDQYPVGLGGEYPEIDDPAKRCASDLHYTFPSQPPVSPFDLALVLYDFKH